MRYNSKIIEGKVYLSGKPFGEFRSVTCGKRSNREEYTECLNCKEKEKCAEIMNNIRKGRKK